MNFKSETTGMYTVEFYEKANGESDLWNDLEKISDQGLFQQGCTHTI